MRHHRFYRHVSSIFFVFSILGGCGGQGRWTKRPKSMTSIVSPIPAPSQNRRATSNQGIGKNWKTSRTIQPWIAKPEMGIGMLCQKASSLARCGNQAVGAISQNFDVNLEHQTFRTPIFHSWQIFKTSTWFMSLHRRHNRFLFRSKLKTIFYNSIYVHIIWQIS